LFGGHVLIGVDVCWSEHVDGSSAYGVDGSDERVPVRW